MHLAFFPIMMSANENGNIRPKRMTKKVNYTDDIIDEVHSNSTAENGTKKKKSRQSISNNYVEKSRKMTKRTKEANEMKEEKSKNGLNESSGSEDEWGEMDIFDDNPGKVRKVPSSLEITVETPKTDNQKKWETYLRREINRDLKEQKKYIHNVHLLCFISHLHHWSLATNDPLISSLALSLVPNGFQCATHCLFTTVVAKKFVKWFKSAFVFDQKSEKIPAHQCITRLASCLERKTVENDRDLAVTMVAILRSIGLDCRICLSCQPVYHKICTKHDANDLEKSGKCRKISNYWVEYWDEQGEQWICIDPLNGSVDEPENVEQNATQPVHYVLAISNDIIAISTFPDGNIADLTARYSANFLSSKIRTLRTDSDWWTEIIAKFRSRTNRPRERLEHLLIHNMLLSRPKPTVISEYKHHPLYVLPRDLLKFEAIYPEDSQSVGKIRNEDIYLRSTVHILRCRESWIQKARVVKDDEEPYKVIKARPKLNIPKEKQIEKPLPLFGFWQTNPYLAKPAENGLVPRNKFGNVELFQQCMLPPGTVHLRPFPDLISIAKRFNVDCVPAMIGWEFHCRGSHPLLDGWVVCEEHADLLVDAWEDEERLRNEQNNQKIRQRALNNWKRLFKAFRTRQNIRRRFAPIMQVKHACGSRSETLETIDTDFAWPQCKARFEIDPHIKCD